MKYRICIIGSTGDIMWLCKTKDSSRQYYVGQYEDSWYGNSKRAGDHKKMIADDLVPQARLVLITIDYVPHNLH